MASIEEKSAEVQSGASPRMTPSVGPEFGHQHDAYGLSQSSVQDEGERSSLSMSSSSLVEHAQLIHEHHDIRNTNNLQSLMNLVKGNIGTGVLALPCAFMYGGLWVSFCGMFFMAGMAVHGMHLLFSCAKRISDKTRRWNMDYADIVRMAFEIGPLPVRRFAPASKVIVNIFLCITQFGFCTVYILFVADNIRQVVQVYNPSNIWCVQVYEAFVLAALIPLLLVRNLKHLSFCSSFANILTVVGLGMVLFRCFQDLPSVSSRPAYSTSKNIALYFGIVVYAFEGIGLVLPISNKMRTPEDFGGWTGVLNLGMTIATCLYVATGFFGYLKFGDDIQDSITLNFTGIGWFASTIRVVFAVAIFISYAIQFYVPIEIMWPRLEPRLSYWWQRKYGEFILRAIFLLLTFILAASIPCLSLMISLVGSLSGSALSFIFPPLLEIVTLLPDGGLGRYHWRLIKDVLIITFGFVGFAVGTTMTIINIVSAFQDGKCSRNCAL